MTKLPVVSGAEAVIALGRAGWRVDRQRGSHIVLLKTGRIASVSVPLHKELAPGTLRSLLRVAEITVEEFTRLL